MLGKVKSTVQGKKESVVGASWLKEVQQGSNGDGQWKTLEQWSAQYEPKKEKKPDSARKAAAKKKVAATAKAKILAALEKGISAKLMQVLYELSSRVLTMAHEELMTNKAAGGPEVQKVGAFMNSCNAIVLSYRFDKKNKPQHKFAYFRKVACQELITLFLEADAKLDASHVQAQQLKANADKMMPAMKQEIQTTLADKQVQVRAILESEFDNILQTANAFVDEKADQHADQMEEKVGQVKAVSEQVGSMVAVSEQVGSMVLDGAGVAPPSGAAGNMNVAIPSKEEVKQQKDQLVATFGGMFKSFLFDKLDQLHLQVTERLESVLDALDEILTKLQQEIDTNIAAKKSNKPALLSKDNNNKQLQDELVKAVESLHVKANEAVAAEVQKVVQVLGAMMAENKEEDDDDNDQEGTVSC